MKRLYLIALTAAFASSICLGSSARASLVPKGDAKALKPTVVKRVQIDAAKKAFEKFGVVTMPQIEANKKTLILMQDMYVGRVRHFFDWAIRKPVVKSKFSCMVSIQMKVGGGIRRVRVLSDLECDALREAYLGEKDVYVTTIRQSAAPNEYLLALMLVKDDEAIQRINQSSTIGAAVCKSALSCFGGGNVKAVFISSPVFLPPNASEELKKTACTALVETDDEKIFRAMVYRGYSSVIASEYYNLPQGIQPINEEAQKAIRLSKLNYIKKNKAESACLDLVSALAFDKKVFLNGVLGPESNLLLRYIYLGEPPEGEPVLPGDVEAEPESIEGDDVEEVPPDEGAPVIWGCEMDIDCDGVLDEFDACPEEPGSIDNGGCPVEGLEEQGGEAVPEPNPEPEDEAEPTP